MKGSSGCAGARRSAHDWPGRAARALLALWVLLSLVPGAGASSGIVAEPAVRAFIERMQAKHGFSAREVTQYLERATIRQQVLDAISRPAEAKPWHEYRAIFLTEARIAGGVSFWAENAQTLARADEVFGVSPAIVVAIIGVETSYGVHKGKTPVLDALCTLAFRYPRRSDFFTSELEHFLLLAREERLDPFSIDGSYAGAMGIPQFISSSYRAYAVDFDGDGIRDLLRSNADAIGSVASYLSEHGWKRGQPITTPASVSGAGHAALVAKGMKPSLSLAEMERSGVRFFLDGSGPERGALMEFELVDGVEHWVGFDNFYTITRYNRSQLYAMAVFQLAEAIRQARRAQDG